MLVAPRLPHPPPASGASTSGDNPRGRDLPPRPREGFARCRHGAPVRGRPRRRREPKERAAAADRGAKRAGLDEPPRRPARRPGAVATTTRRRLAPDLAAGAPAGAAVGADSRTTSSTAGRPTAGDERTKLPGNDTVWTASAAELTAGAPGHAELGQRRGPDLRASSCRSTTTTCSPPSSACATPPRRAASACFPGRASAATTRPNVSGYYILFEGHARRRQRHPAGNQILRGQERGRQARRAGVRRDRRPAAGPGSPTNTG